MAALRRRSFLGGAQICPVLTGVPSLAGLHSEHTGDGKNHYGPGTLLAKWLEERNGLDEIQKMKPLASQFEHAYRTIYMDSYGKPEIKRRMFKCEPHVFPGHQPELNPPHTKVVPKTTYMLDYVDPVLQMNPLPQSQPDTVEKKQLEYCGPPVPPDMDTDAEKHQLCVSYIPLEPCSPTDVAAVKGRQSEDFRFCGSYIPTEGPLGQCTAELCEPCTPVVVPSRPGLAACCGPIIP